MGGDAGPKRPACLRRPPAERAPHALAHIAIFLPVTLFGLIGTTYGGDGQSTFALPDLRGRIPLHHGNGFTLGETGGMETITLTELQIPAPRGSSEVRNPGFRGRQTLA